MTQAAKVQEPSMEEILASIRRIIADDDAGKGEQPEATTAAASPPRPFPSVAQGRQDVDAMIAEIGEQDDTSDADVFDLTEAMTANPAVHAQPNFRTIDAEPDVVFTERAKPRAVDEPRRLPQQQAYAPQPSIAPPPYQPQPVAAPVQPMPSSSFAQPSQSVPPSAERSPLLSANTSAAVDGAFNALANTILGQNARTLEDLVKEMMRPMLKSWLDDNLPNLVERIVRTEIERVSRRG